MAVSAFSAEAQSLHSGWFDSPPLCAAHRRNSVCSALLAESFGIKFRFPKSVGAHGAIRIGIEGLLLLQSVETPRAH
jgi:hypothetical protein